MGKLKYRPYDPNRPVHCPDCGSRFHADRLAMSAQCPDCKAVVDLRPIEDGKPPKPVIDAIFRDKPLVVEDEHGTRVDGRAKCDVCRRVERYLWRFPRSNYGEVQLCEGCKKRVVSRSFQHKRRKIDVMDMHPIIQTFESKRPPKRRFWEGLDVPLPSASPPRSEPEQGIFLVETGTLSLPPSWIDSNGHPPRAGFKLRDDTLIITTEEDSREWRGIRYGAGAATVPLPGKWFGLAKRVTVLQVGNNLEVTRLSG